MSGSSVDYHLKFYAVFAANSQLHRLGIGPTELCTQGSLEVKRNLLFRMSCGVACVALKDFLKIDGAAVITIDKLMAA